MLRVESAFRLPKSFVFAAVFGFLSALCLAQGCGGAKFAGDTHDSGGAGAQPSEVGGTDATGDGGAGVSGSGAQGAGGDVTAGCHGPEDCSDGDPCTRDLCRRDGVCVLSAKCASDQKCCEGDCAECCEDSDCEDAVECTEDVCFAGTCQHQPDSSRCGEGRYCSLFDDCVGQEPCQAGDAAACDDGSSCTSDRCERALCVHAFCAAATLCCPETGCADECCSDQDCHSDDDPCMVGVCRAGRCSQAARCAEGEECCASAEGGATCGSCCAAADCDDGIDCTENACAAGKCQFTPNNKLCPLLQTCNVAKRGCVVL